MSLERREYVADIDPEARFPAPRYAIFAVVNGERRMIVARFRWRVWARARAERLNADLRHLEGFDALINEIERGRGQLPP